jgi:Uma2 family endonuclease
LGLPAFLFFMQTGEVITVREYLSTSYRPDCDYVDGMVVDRHLGEKDHAKLQRRIVTWFDNRSRELDINVFPEQTVQVSPTRFRVPDVCVVLGEEPDEQIFTEPPFICIEVLSPDDRLAAMKNRVEDFLGMGVPYVWILDPRSRRAWRVSHEGLLAVPELRTESPEIVVPLDALFAA